MYTLPHQPSTPQRSAFGRPSRRRWPRIAGACAAVLGIVTTVGCSAMRLPLVCDAIKAGRIAGVPPSATGMMIFPDHWSRRRYEQVALLQDVHIGTAGGGLITSAQSPQWEGHYSFVLGRRSSDGEWEIISVAVLADDETWREVRLNPTAGNEGEITGSGVLSSVGAVHHQ